MKFLSFFALLLALSTPAFAAPSTSIYQAKPTGPAMQTQRFQISYETTFAGTKPTPGIVTVWIPFPLDDEAQSVEKYSLGGGLPPEKLLSVALITDSYYGNRFWEIKVLDPSPDEKISCEYTVVRREQSNPPSGEIRRDVTITPPSPTSDISSLLKLGTMNSEWGDAEIQQDYERTIAILKPEAAKDQVGHLGSSGASDARQSNAFEFAALLAAILRIPMTAKTESGFFIPSDQADGVLAPYAWTYAFHPQRGWVPLDAFAAAQNPKLADYYLGHIGSDRVAFCIGQNLKLGQRGAPLAVFVAPYAEDAAGQNVTMKLSATFKKLVWP